MGTTEEALANAEKIGFNTGLFALHPFDKKIKLPIFIGKLCFNGLWNGCYIWLSSA